MVVGSICGPACVRRIYSAIRVVLAPRHLFEINNGELHHERRYLRVRYSGQVTRPTHTQRRAWYGNTRLGSPSTLKKRIDETRLVGKTEIAYEVFEFEEDAAGGGPGDYGRGR